MSTKVNSAEQAVLRANRAALAAQRRIDAESALKAARAEQDAVRERTDRLRALRLAKEADDAVAVAAKAALPATARKPSKKKA